MWKWIWMFNGYGKFQENTWLGEIWRVISDIMAYTYD